MAEVRPGQAEEGRGQALVTKTLDHVARALVEHPGDVKITVESSEGGPLYRLRVHPDDLGRVIGKSGRIARALRQVARAAAARAGETAMVEIGD